jgi:hypothetical protein
MMMIRLVLDLSYTYGTAGWTLLVNAIVGVVTTGAVILDGWMVNVPTVQDIGDGVEVSVVVPMIGGQVIIILVLVLLLLLQPHMTGIADLIIFYQN